MLEMYYFYLNSYFPSLPNILFLMLNGGGVVEKGCKGEGAVELFQETASLGFAVSDVGALSIVLPWVSSGVLVRVTQGM
jgi:hypothetical protein